MMLLAGYTLLEIQYENDEDSNLCLRYFLFFGKIYDVLLSF